MITFYVDELLPCLKENETGEIYETEVLRLKRKSFLSKFNDRTGWFINWSKLPDDTEVYALVLKGTNDIQGLVAVAYDEEALAVNIRWACAAPHNDKWRFEQQKFSGVGGHLLAIASELSVRHGYEGFVYGEAMDKKLFEYYCKEFNALPLPPTSNPYKFMLSDETTRSIREVYNYDWTDEII